MSSVASYQGNVSETSTRYLDTENGHGVLSLTTGGVGKDAEPTHTARGTAKGCSRVGRPFWKLLTRFSTR